MRHIYFLLLALSLIGSAGGFSAAMATDAPAFVQVEFTLPKWSDDPLTVNFTLDKEQCRKAYGDDWQSQCSVYLGMYGKPVQGVELRGDAIPEGEWRWDGSTEMIFTPRTPWRENTSFTVDMTRLSIPARVKVNTRVLKGATRPLSGLIPKGEVWIDPSVSGPRAVSFAVRFTAPVDKSLEKGMTLKAAGPNVGLGKMQVVWGQNATSCVVNVPLTALPDNDTVLTLHVAGVRSLDSREGAGKGKTAVPLQQMVTVPGKKRLFRVNSAQMRLEYNHNLQREYRLVLKTSLLVPAADLLKALQVVELPRLQNPEASTPYEWSRAPVISKADLDKARPLEVSLVGQPTAAHEVTVRVPATPGSYVNVQLPAGFGPKGYGLSAPWAQVFKASDSVASVDFLQPGNVLTLVPGGDNKLDIAAYGVDEVRWRAQRLRMESLNLMEIMTANNDRYSIFDYYIDLATTAVEGSIPLPGAANGLTPSFATLPMGELMRGGTGLMQVELSGRLKGKDVVTKRRVLLATDLGMVSKVLPDGSRQVFVCSLSSGQPVPDVLVRILGANGQGVTEARTNTEGVVHLPAVRGLTREKAPVALVALRGAAAQGQKPGEAGQAQSMAQSMAQGMAQDMAQGMAQNMAQDMAWMALDDPARRVDYSRFPTQGQTSSPDNLNAYVFGQRGIFRPGETLRFGVIVRRGDWKPLPADMPLLATLTDPAGRVALRRTFTVAEGLTDISWASQETSPTGRYRMDVTMPASEATVGSGAVRVEEFQPDTLALRTELVKPAPAGAADQKPHNVDGVGWLVTTGGNADAVLDVYVRNFYGLPAEGRRVRAEMTVSRAPLSFAGFEDFIFPDMLPVVLPEGAATATPLPEVRTTAEGKASVALPLGAYQQRTMFCRVLVEGFEADGGRAVTTEKTFVASPLAVMLGHRNHGAVDNTDYVPQGTQGGLEFVALGPDLRPADVTKLGALRLSVAERHYITVLATDAQGKYVYEENPVDKEISGSTATLDAKGRLIWAMPTNKPGEFLLTVRDRDNHVMARIPYTVAGNDNLTPALEERVKGTGSTQMRLRLDKTDYAPGDTVNVFMAVPFEGVGLMTLERDSVAKHVWFKAPAGHSVHSLTIPKDFEGRGYINVTMGRAVSSSEIFMQPHSYAVAPLTVNADGRDMGLKITAPAEVLPGSDITARLTARQSGKALIFAVDEGVLQLTKFTTPAPLRYLLLDRALEVKTDQFFDLLMPVHAQIGKRLAAFGGDMHMGGGRFHNPFKRRNEPPLAWWSGLVDVGPQGTEVRIPVPVYTSSQVRIMAVAVSENTVGATEASTVSRAPLVITPQLPLMSAPGDIFEGGVSLHNTTKHPMTVGLHMEAKGLKLEKPAPDSVDVAAGKEVFVPLRMVGGDVPGEASMMVTATVMPTVTGAAAETDKNGSAGLRVQRITTLSLRPPVLPRQEQQAGFAAPAATAATALPDGNLPAKVLTRGLYAFKADASASVSSAPLPPLRVLLAALATYPYQCVEQSISRAFPLMLLQRRAGLVDMLTPPEINGKPRAEAHAAMQDQALTALRSGFRAGAGMAPWPDADHVDGLLTAYAGDYLVSMRESGWTVPGDIASGFFTGLKDSINTTPESLSEARATAYKLWVLTRHGEITSHWLDNLRANMGQRWPAWEKDVAATLLAGSYAIMNMHERAQALLNAADGGQLLESNDAVPLTPMAARALHVAVLAKHFPQQLTDNAGVLAERLLEGVNSTHGSTMEAALGARALLELAAPALRQKGATDGKTGGGTGGGAGGAPGENPFAGVELRCVAWQPGFESTVASAASVQGQSLISLSAPGCTQFSLSTPVKAPLYWDVRSDGYDRTPPTKAVNNGMEVTRVLKLQGGSALPFSEGEARVAQGTVLRVELTARVFGSGTFSGSSLLPVVLADLMPGGFELVLSHPDDVTPTSDKPQAYTRLDRREDRVLAHASLDNNPATFVYHWRAVNRGRYTLPAAYGEGLYDRGLNSHTAAGVIVVQ